MLLERIVESDVTPQKDGSSSTPGVKTLKRKKIVKKLVAKAIAKAKVGVGEFESAESKAKQNEDDRSMAVVPDTAAKTTVLKKIVKKLAKKKAVVSAYAKTATGDALKSENEGLKDEKVTEANIEKTDLKAEIEAKTPKKQEKQTGKKTNQVSSASGPDSEKKKG